MSLKSNTQSPISRLTLPQYEQEIRTLQSRMRSLLTFKYVLNNAVLWTLVWGTVSLVLRMLGGVPVRTLLWGGIGWIVAIVWAVFLAAKRIPGEAIFRAWIDQQVRCGGLFMASGEVELGQWDLQLPAATIPTFAWRSAPSWLALCASLVFLGACFLAPEQQFRPATPHHLAIGEQVGQLNQQIQTLKQERVITKQRAEDLQKKLARLQKQAKGMDPAKTLQALDHVSQKLQHLGTQAAEKSLAQAERWSRAEKLASRLTKLAQQKKPMPLSRGMKKLSKMLQKALRADPALRKRMMKGMMKGMRKLSLKPSHLRHVKKICRGGRRGMGKRLSRLSKMGLVKGRTLASFRKRGGKGKSGKPGKGGISRGPGDALMSFLKPSSTPKGAKFKPTVLPPATVLHLLSSQAVGMSVGRPTQKGKAGHSSVGGVLGKTVSGQSAAHLHTIYPEHLGTIRRYFQRGKQK